MAEEVTTFFKEGPREKPKPKGLRRSGGGLKRTEFKRKPPEPGKAPKPSTFKPPKHDYHMWLWSLLVRIRDNFTCRMCGVRKATQAHHVVRRDVQRYRYRLNNGVSLCDPCNAEVEAWKCPGWKVKVAEADGWMANGGQQQLPGATLGLDDLDVKEEWPTAAEAKRHYDRMRECV